MLFTADLRAFSERLKAEVKEESITKVESIEDKASLKIKIETSSRVKREYESGDEEDTDEKIDVTDVKEDARAQRAKRRRWE